MMNWLNNNAGAVQAISTVALLTITAWYAWRTHEATALAEREFRRLLDAEKPSAVASIEGGLDPTRDVIDYGFRYAFILTNTGRNPIHVLAPKLRAAMPEFGGYFEVTLRHPLTADTPESFPRAIQPGGLVVISANIEDLKKALADSTDQHGNVDAEVVWRDTLGNSYEVRRNMTVDFQRATTSFPVMQAPTPPPTAGITAERHTQRSSKKIV